MRSARLVFISLAPYLTLAMAACSSNATKPIPDAAPDGTLATDTSLVVPDSAVPDSTTSGETARPALLTVSPTRLALGTLAVGVASPRQTITVTATSRVSDLTVTVPDGNLTLAGSTCGSTLAAGASCTVTIVFLAATSGNKQDSVVIRADGQSTTVTVTATVGGGGDLVIRPSSAQTFAVTIGQSSSPIMFELSNPGDATAGPIDVSITGAGAREFVVSATDCGYLAPLAVCTITVVFRPTVVGASAAVLTVTVGASGSAAVPLSGTAYPEGHGVITPVQGDLGSVVVGTTGPSVTYTVTNTSAAAVTVSTAVLSSPEFVLTADHCSGTSVPGQGGTCTIAVALRPSSIGVKTATLTITLATGSPTVKTLTGTGVLPIDGGIDGGIDAIQDAPMDAGLDLQPGEASSPVIDGGAG